MSSGKTLAEAQAALLALARKVKGEDVVPLAQAQGRILAEDLVSPIALPPADNSAMDGYALRAADVPQAGMRLAVTQRIQAGEVSNPLAAGTAARIFTGAMLPQGADCVVKQEDCRAENVTERDGTENHTAAPQPSVTIQIQPRSGQNVRRAGEDIAAGAHALTAGTLLTPAAIAVAAATGAATLRVMRPVTVALLATGDELTMPGLPLPPGGIYNSNQAMLAALLRDLGCVIEDLGKVADTPDAVRRALRRGASLADIVLSSGGVSVGEADYLRQIVAEEGTLEFWQVAIKPGKPFAFGTLAQADFIGLPGNPVSAFVTFALLVVPFIRACQGAQPSLRTPCYLPAAFTWNKPGNRREFLRVRMDETGKLACYPNQGSGAMHSLHWAHGLADIAAGRSIAPGDTLPFYAWPTLLS